MCLRETVLQGLCLPQAHTSGKRRNDKPWSLAGRQFPAKHPPQRQAFQIPESPAANADSANLSISSTPAGLTRNSERHDRGRCFSGSSCYPTGGGSNQQEGRQQPAGGVAITDRRRQRPAISGRGLRESKTGTTTACRNRLKPTEARHSQDRQDISPAGATFRTVSLRGGSLRARRTSTGKAAGRTRLSSRTNRQS